MADILKPAFAGSFYPSDPSRLEMIVKQFLDCPVTPVERAVGLVVPHAGYVYSGKTAGYGFAMAPDDVSTVVIVAPSHRYPLRTSTVFNIDYMQTPLGLCPVDRSAVQAISTGTESVVFNEHSLEVMIPFVQIRWPQAKVVPIVLGLEPNCSTLAGLIQRFAPDAFVIASSDLSHFYPLQQAKILDRMVIDAFLRLSPLGITDKLHACGRLAIRTLLYVSGLRGAQRAVEVDYSTSADAGAGTDEVVGYFSGLVI